jgi:hypothetical protein
MKRRVPLKAGEIVELIEADAGISLRPAEAGTSVSGGLATVDLRDFAGGSGIHSDSSAGVLDGQRGGTQSPAGSVVCPTSIR